jgi:alanyl-tRNA synthetase
MATRKLYHEDATLLETEAILLRQLPAEGRWAVVLDRTVLFPGGGGQPEDRGWVGDREVVGSADEGDEVVHYLATPLEGAKAGDAVKVRVDATRRRESAQQHTGQHIVSACLLSRGGYQTVSVHMGEDTMTVESPVPAIPDEAVRAVEECANRTICENRPVRSHLVPGEDLERWNLRRAAAPRELYRIVEIEGHDASACGGVHVGRTGEVGLVKCVGVEKIRGNARSIWLVGDRAFRDYARKTDIVRELGAELSAPAAELGAAVRRLRDEAASLRERVEELERDAAVAAAGGLVAGGERCPSAVVVVHRAAGMSRGAFRALGAELVRRGDVAALLANVEAGSAQLFACRPADAGIDLGTILRPHLALARAKGGGREGTWQGSAQDTTGVEAFLAAARKALREACGA